MSSGDETLFLRRRRGEDLTKTVQQFDIFDKVQESAKEEKRTISGLISFVCFSLIFVLVVADSWQYFFGKKSYDYKFRVDTDMKTEPLLTIDMMVAGPCSKTSTASSISRPDYHLNDFLKKDPTRFEFTDEENLYWTVLRHAHANLMEKGKRGVEDLLYIDSDVEEELERQADTNQQEQTEKLEEVNKKMGADNRNFPGMIIMLGNGFGMLQIVSDNNNDEGTACRIHGSFNVPRGKEETLAFTLLPVGIRNEDGSIQTANSSHRIEKFHFGPHVPGLVTPLAGVEQISLNGADTYRYFIKIVPTKLFNGFLQEPKLFYQYSLTFVNRSAAEGGVGIAFEFEFASTVIEVYESQRSLTYFLVSICSIVGGMYACSSIINGLVHAVGRLATPATTSANSPRTADDDGSVEIKTKEFHFSNVDHQGPVM